MNENEPVAGWLAGWLAWHAGEFAAFLTGANLIMEYVLSNAAVVRSFTAYLGKAVGVDAPSKWRIPVPGLPQGFNQVDLVGVIFLMFLRQSHLFWHSHTLQLWTALESLSCLAKPGSILHQSSIVSVTNSLGSMQVGIIMYLPTSDARQRKEITEEFFSYRSLARSLWDDYSAYEHWAKIEVPTSFKINYSD